MPGRTAVGSADVARSASSTAARTQAMRDGKAAMKLRERCMQAPMGTKVALRFSWQAEVGAKKMGRKEITTIRRSHTTQAKRSATRDGRFDGRGGLLDDDLYARVAELRRGLARIAVDTVRDVEV